MKWKDVFSRDKFFYVFSIFCGLVVGLSITAFCVHRGYKIFGINVDIFISPLVAGFVETFISNYTRKKSSGAISAIILFFITNGIGWLFPSQPLKLNIFTVGGFIIFLQAAFPLMMNYLLIGVFFLFTYVSGLLGSYVALLFHPKDNSPTVVSQIEDLENLDVLVFNSTPDIPIKEYHGLVFSEDILEFEDKTSSDRLKYISSKLEDKNEIKYNDYAIARKYILHSLQEEAIKMNANAIIEMQFEYTNYNQQMPPDVLIAAYGTAVTLDEKYLK